MILQTEMAVDVATVTGSLDLACFKRLFKADQEKLAKINSVLHAKHEIQKALNVDLGEAILKGAPPDRRKAEAKAKQAKKRKGPE
jgi:hypothetical protein